MAKFIKHIFDALSLETLYKYVLNSCVCRSECCSENNCCLCQCQSNEIQHHEEDDDFIGCMKICCGSSAVEDAVEEVLSSDEDEENPYLFSSKRNI